MRTLFESLYNPEELLYCETWPDYRPNDKARIKVYAPGNPSSACQPEALLDEIIEVAE